MAIMEKIITIKVKYDDQKGRDEPEVAVCSTMRCCFYPENVEVINVSPPREVINEDTFKS